MTKYLYLLRHGEAEQRLFGSDFQRKLTERGADTLRSLGIEMKQKSFYPETVYCSTAMRTRQTAQIFLDELDYDQPVRFLDEIYEASVNSLLKLVTETDKSVSSLLLIGHNPGISYLLEHLTGSSFQNLSPGELVSITFEEFNWSELSKGLGIKNPL